MNVVVFGAYGDTGRFIVADLRRRGWPAVLSGRDREKRRGEEERRLVARGRDIYAVTASLVVEAMERIVEGRASATGVVAPGEAFDAPDFLRALGADGAI